MQKQNNRKLKKVDKKELDILDRFFDDFMEKRGWIQNKYMKKTFLKAISYES